MEEETDRYGLPTRYVPRKEREAADYRKQGAARPATIAWLILAAVVITVAYLASMLARWHGC